jgi:RHS repeat-associated protein
VYRWDELGQLDRAQRWDLTGAERSGNDEPTEPTPARNPDVELRYAYDSDGQRVVKTAVDPASTELHTVYINTSYELRRTSYTSGDYELTRATATVYVAGGGVRGRVLYSEEDLPSLTSGHQRLFLELGDYLGSNTVIIDHETGELVEYSTYQPYGATESDYRPERWGQFREEYKFTGKEEDVEVGLQYFGARYLVVGLGRWASADPVTIHALRGDPNPYAYVGGMATNAIDPDGKELITLGAIAVGIAIGAAIGAGTAAAVYTATNWDDWSLEGFGTAAGIGALSGAVGGAVGGFGTGLLGGGIAVGASSTPFIGGLGWSAGWAAVGGGALGSVGGSVAGTLASGQAVTWQSVALSATTGAASAGVYYYLSSIGASPPGPQVRAAENSPVSSTPAPEVDLEAIDPLNTVYGENIQFAEIPDVPDPPFDPATEQRLGTLRPDLQPVARQHLSELRDLAIDARLAHLGGARTSAGQADAFARGVGAAPGNSAHEYGAAYDLTVYENGRPIGTAHPGYDIGADIGQNDLGLRWGHTFRPGDYGHFEPYNWRSLPGLQRYGGPQY